MFKITDGKKNPKSFMATRNARKEFQRGIRYGLHEVGRDNLLFLRKILDQPNKHGRWYFIHGKWHRASAPYEAPAKLTGKLLNSTAYKVRTHHSLEIGDQMYYGKFLEKGTVKMEPRPHLKTMERFKRRKNVNTLQDSVYSRINRAKK